MTLRSSFYLLLISFALCWGAYHQTRSPSPQAAEQSVSSDPDFYIHGFEYKAFDETGQMTKKIHSRLVTHVPLDNQYALNTPDIFLKQSEKTVYSILADKAKTKNAFDEVTFIGHVHFKQLETKANDSPFQLFTSRLTYLSEKEQAFTDKPVVLEQQPNHIHAKGGMFADLKHNHLTFNQAQAALRAEHVSRRI